MKINKTILLKLCFMFNFFVTMACSFALQNNNDENSICEKEYHTCDGDDECCWHQTCKRREWNDYSRCINKHFSEVPNCGYERLCNIAEDEGNLLDVIAAGVSEDALEIFCGDLCDGIHECNSFRYCPSRARKCFFYDKWIEGDEPTKVEGDCYTSYKSCSLDKSECRVDECWCVSAGGTTCSSPESGICEPDECYDREDCHGNGYWCDTSSGENVTTKLPSNSGCIATTNSTTETQNLVSATPEISPIEENCTNFVARADVSHEKVMVPEKMKLSCKVEIDDAFENSREDLFWKTCTWTRVSDNTKCQITAIDDSSYNKDNCDSSFGEHVIGAEDDRLACILTLLETKDIDHGEWECTLQKCRDRKFGGCKGILGGVTLGRSSCITTAVVNATVLPHQDLITDVPKDARDGGIIHSAISYEQFLPIIWFIIGVFN